jgi:hypothetical protein
MEVGNNTAHVYSTIWIYSLPLPPALRAPQTCQTEHKPLPIHTNVFVLNAA